MCMCVPVPVRAPVRLFANETPSSGLQHPFSLEEGAGKRDLECVCLSLLPISECTDSYPPVQLPV